MKTASIVKNLEFNDKRPSITVLMETENTKEIRIALAMGQTMKEHKTPFPIVVQIFEGEIFFGVEGEKLHLKKGDLISLKGNVLHDLVGIENSIIRLSLSKGDSAERVFSLVE